MRIPRAGSAGPGGGRPTGGSRRGGGVSGQPGDDAGRAAELARLRAVLQRAEAAADARSAPVPAGGAPLRLERVETPHGPAFRRVEALALPPGFREVAGSRGTVFLDTETTGLAGGTGTYVFLVGLGRLTGGAFRITQYFLPDLDAEPAFLAAVRAEVEGARELVTYNGRTFDLPLLETRYLLQRAPWWGPGIPHRDLYPLARALWRGRAPDCRLTTLEAAVLALDRGDDLPAWAVPQLYFRYLRTRDRWLLPRLFLHNRWDLVALAGLRARAEALLAGPRPGHDPREYLGAARWLERADPGRSAAFYRAALEGPLPEPLRLLACWRLGRLCRRQGRPEEALRLWGSLAAHPAAPLGLLVDLAKLREHVARDFAGALEAARRALGRVEPEVAPELRELAREALRHRIRRLERRLARARR